MEKLYLIIFFILGSGIGTISTILGLRLPKQEKIFGNKLHCDNCSHELKKTDTIPIISYIIQHGRCRYCNTKIDILYPYMEFFSGLLFSVAYYSFGFSYELLIALGIITMLMIIVVSDLTYLIIPDEVLIFFSIYFIIIQLLNIGLKGTLMHIGTGILLFAIMYLIMLIGNKALKKESLGGGDIKMMFLFGLVLDPLLGTISIFLGSLFALPMSLYLMNKNKEKAIPFGPFLLIAFTFIYFTKITSTTIMSWLGF